MLRTKKQDNTMRTTVKQHSDLRCSLQFHCTLCASMSIVQQGEGGARKEQATVIERAHLVCLQSQGSYPQSASLAQQALQLPGLLEALLRLWR